METRTCKKCSRIRVIDDFPIYNRKTGKRRYECIDCNKKRVDLHHQENREKRLAQARERYNADPFAYWHPARRKRANEVARARYEKLRSEVFERHGGECQACGETEWLFLTLDHRNNDGWKQRAKDPYRQAGAGLYKKILRYGMPDDIEILCFNCNFGKRRNGGVLVRDRRRR